MREIERSAAEIRDFSFFSLSADRRGLSVGIFAFAGDV